MILIASHKLFKEDKMRIQPVMYSNVQNYRRNKSQISSPIHFKAIITDMGYMMKYLETLENEKQINTFLDAYANKRIPLINKIMTVSFESSADLEYKKEKIKREILDYYAKYKENKKKKLERDTLIKKCQDEGYYLIPPQEEPSNKIPYSSKVYGPPKYYFQSGIIYEIQTENPKPNPKNHTPKEIIEERKRLTAQGQKSYLDNEDFYWQYDPETKTAYFWTLDRNIFDPALATEQERSFFDKCAAHLDEKTLKERVFRKINFSHTIDTNKKLSKAEYDTNIDYINKCKQIPERKRKLQVKYLKGNSELLMHQKELQLRFFDVLKKAESDSSIEIPNGILITGETEESIKTLTDWIKQQQAAIFQKAPFKRNNLKYSFKELETALEKAETDYFITGKRTLIDVSDFAELLTNYS